MNIKLLSLHFAMISLLIILPLASELRAEDDTGYLNVISEPRRALIYLDGKFTNSITPIQQLLGLSAGRYRIELGKQGYKLYQDKVVIEQGQTLELSVILAAVNSEEISRTVSRKYIEAYIIVKSDPVGADVYLDEKLIGETPIRDLRIPAGEPGDRKIKITKSGYEPHEETISWTTIENGIKVYVSPTLKLAVEPVSAKSPLKTKKSKKFIFTNQVIFYCIVLIALILVVLARIIVRLRRGDNTD